MHRERLDILIDVLAQVAAADRLFDMTAWIENRAPRGQAPEPCQTACCALGYAALDTRLQAMGLSLVGRLRDEHGYNEHVTIDSKLHFNRLVIAGRLATTVEPCFEGNYGYRAGTLFFDIDYDAAAFLFNPDSYRGKQATPEQVIERVRMVIGADGELPDYTLLDDYDDDEDAA